LTWPLLGAFHLAVPDYGVKWRHTGAERLFFSRPVGAAMSCLFLPRR